MDTMSAIIAHSFLMYKKYLPRRIGGMLLSHKDLFRCLAPKIADDGVGGENYNVSAIRW